MQQLLTTSGPAGSMACLAVAAKAGSHRSAFPETRAGRWPSGWRPNEMHLDSSFSAHPVDTQRHLLAAHKVRSFAEVAALPAPADGGRSTSMLAGLVEGARWRVSAKGRRFLTATLSDASGQYEATAFDDEPSADLENAAKSGTCGLMTVELDRRPGDDMPRVTVKTLPSARQPGKEVAATHALAHCRSGVAPRGRA